MQITLFFFYKKLWFLCYPIIVILFVLVLISGKYEYADINECDCYWEDPTWYGLPAGTCKFLNLTCITMNKQSTSHKGGGGNFITTKIWNFHYFSNIYFWKYSCKTCIVTQFKSLWNQSQQKCLKQGGIMLPLISTNLLIIFKIMLDCYSREGRHYCICL